MRTTQKLRSYDTDVLAIVGQLTEKKLQTQHFVGVIRYYNYPREGPVILTLLDL